MRACTRRRAAVFIIAALLNYRETGREQNDYGWEISTSLAVSARAVQVINVLIGWVAFAVPRNFIHRSDFDPDVPLVHLVNLWQTPFSGRAFIFHALKKKKNNHHQTNAAPGPGSRSQCESQCVHFQIQQAAELKALPVK